MIYVTLNVKSQTGWSGISPTQPSPGFTENGWQVGWFVSVNKLLMSDNNSQTDSSSHESSYLDGQPINLQQLCEAIWIRIGCFQFPVESVLQLQHP